MYNEHKEEFNQIRNDRLQGKIIGYVINITIKLKRIQIVFDEINFINDCGSIQLFSKSGYVATFDKDLFKLQFGHYSYFEILDIRTIHYDLYLN